MTDDQWLRVVLELMILFCAGISIHALKRDWNLLRPPYWRIIITALVTVVLGHAAATVLLLTTRSEITVGTYISFGVYAAAAVLLLFAGHHARRR